MGWKDVASVLLYAHAHVLRNGFNLWSRSKNKLFYLNVCVVLLFLILLNNTFHIPTQFLNLKPNCFDSQHWQKENIYFQRTTSDLSDLFNLISWRFACGDCFFLDGYANHVSINWKYVLSPHLTASAFTRNILNRSSCRIMDKKQTDTCAVADVRLSFKTSW